MKTHRITSEVGRLQTVLIHQPGFEHRKTVPWNKDAMLFDDILDLDAARREHRGFADELSVSGVNVVYLLDLLKEVCEDRTLREKVYLNFLGEELMARVDLKRLEPWHLIHGWPNRYLITPETPVPPLPNLYFTRDPAFVIHDCLIIAHLFWPARKQEGRLLQSVFSLHPDWSHLKVYSGLIEDPEARVEGGDVLVADEHTVMVGVGERTNEAGVEHLARFLFENTPVERVLKVFLPAKREFMHLDTVLTFVDRQRILTLPYLWDRPEYYAGVAEKAKAICEKYHHRYTGPSPEELAQGSRLEVMHSDGRRESVSNVLEGLANLEIINPDWTVWVGGRLNLYPSQEEHIVAALREQWNDAANTFALAPGRVVCYQRNSRTLQALEEAHVDLVTFHGSELVRGRG
ncbi:MAG: hypothetical protein KC518_14140, partial [Candidatus Cloacimonetes bacterium]|nr:hypothetical protein [Candidatus Cloacimonadota bacterium]